MVAKNLIKTHVGGIVTLQKYVFIINTLFVFVSLYVFLFYILCLFV